MKRGHSNVSANKTRPWSEIDNGTPAGVAHIPIGGGATFSSWKELPPLSLRKEEWEEIGCRMGWMALEKMSPTVAEKPIELRTSDSISENATKIGKQAEIYADRHKKSLAEVVEMLASSILGNAWVDDDLQANLLQSFGSDLECAVWGEADEDDEDSFEVR